MAYVPGSFSDTARHVIIGVITHLSKLRRIRFVLCNGGGGGGGGNPAPVVSTGGGGGGGGGSSGVTVTLSGMKNSAPFEFSALLHGCRADEAVRLLRSIDGKFALDIPSGTVLRDKVGNALKSFSAASIDSPSDPPSDSVSVIAYGSGQDGATSKPDVNLTLNYDPNTLAIHGYVCVSARSFICRCKSRCRRRTQGSAMRCLAAVAGRWRLYPEGQDRPGSFHWSTAWRRRGVEQSARRLALSMSSSALAGARRRRGVAGPGTRRLREAAGRNSRCRSRDAAR